MPKGPQGQKRPADVIGNAVHVMRIATGQVADTKRNSKTEASRKGGLKGGKSRAVKLSQNKRKAIAKKAAITRWKARPVHAEEE
jgi:predicted Zn-dependent protease